MSDSHYTENSNMEAGDGSFKQNKMITTAWDEDWEAFKLKFEVTADLNGLNEAVSVGQLLDEWEEIGNFITSTFLKISSESIFFTSSILK